jgi:hypothetical protein
VEQCNFPAFGICDKSGGNTTSQSTCSLSIHIMSERQNQNDRAKWDFKSISIAWNRQNNTKQSETITKDRDEPKLSEQKCQASTTPVLPRCRNDLNA